MTRTYSFSELRVIPASRELWRGDRLVALPPPVFDSLTYLLEHRARAVGRDELVAAVWGKTEVSDTLLGQTILRIRRELGDDAKEQRLLRTIPRFGYRWVGPCEVSEGAEVTKPAAAGDAASTPPPAQDGIVLPADASNDSVSPLPEPAVVVPPPQAAPVAAPSPADVPSAPDEAMTAAVAPKAARRSVAAIALGALAAVVLLGVAVWNWRSHQTASTPAPAEARPGTALVSAVLPAVVEPGAEWAWMRLGMMDAVATHLRNSGFPSVPSEDVVALLKAPEGNRSRDLRDVLGARLLVTPRVRHAGADDWQVNLDADDGDYRKYSAEGRGPDAAAAARAASDQLLVALGRRPTGAREETAEATLVRRIDAAALADDLDSARALIAQASPEEQQSPEVRLRLAKIDYRAGKLEAARKRLEAMLDEAPAQTAAVLRASILNGLGSVALALDQPAQANRFFGESIPLLESHSEPEQLGQAYLGRAAAAAEQRQFDAAAADYARARIAYRQANDALALIRVAADEGFRDYDQRRPARALAQLATATEGFKQWGALNEAIVTSVGQVNCHLALLDGRAAMQAADAAEELAQRIDNQYTRNSLRLARARALLAVGRLNEARTLLEGVRATGNPIIAAAAEGALARLELDGNQPAAAEELAGHAVSVLTTANHAGLRADAWLTQFRAELRGSDRGRVTSTLTAFENWAGDSDEPRARLFARLARAEYARKAGAGGDWRLAFADARDLASRDGIPYEIALVAKSYVDALLAEGDVEAAAVEVGRVSRWSDQDFGCAVLEARLYAATGRNEARQTAVARAQSLAGERPIPADALSVAVSTRAAKH